MAGLRVAVVVSSIRDGRMGDRVLKFVKKQFETVLAPNGHTLTVIDPKDYDLEVIKKPLHFYADRSEAPDIIHQLNKQILDADAYIMILAEYNRTLPPAFTNTLDHVPSASYKHKPSCVVSYSMGSSGGIAAALAALPFLNELGCLCVKPFTYIPTVHKELSEDGATENGRILKTIGDELKELEWWATATKNRRKETGEISKC